MGSGAGLGRREKPRLRLIDAQTGQPVLTRAERIAEEQQRAERLEAEVARLRLLLGQTGAENAGPASLPE